MAQDMLQVISAQCVAHDKHMIAPWLFKRMCWRLGLAVRGGNTECTDMGCLGMVYRYGSKSTGIPEPTQGAELSLSLSVSLSHTHAHACTCTHTRTHTHYAHPPTPPFWTYLFPSCYLHVTSSSYLPSVSVYRSCQYALGSATRNPLNLA